jgi:hypothetical protein
LVRNALVCMMKNLQLAPAFKEQAAHLGRLVRWIRAVIRNQMRDQSRSLSPQSVRWLNDKDTNDSGLGRSNVFRSDFKMSKLWEL